MTTSPRTSAGSWPRNLCPAFPFPVHIRPRRWLLFVLLRSRRRPGKLVAGVGVAGLWLRRPWRRLLRRRRWPWVLASTIWSAVRMAVGRRVATVPRVTTFPTRRRARSGEGRRSILRSSRGRWIGLMPALRFALARRISKLAFVDGAWMRGMRVAFARGCLRWVVATFGFARWDPMVKVYRR